MRLRHIHTTTIVLFVVGSTGCKANHCGTCKILEEQAMVGRARAARSCERRAPQAQQAMPQGRTTGSRFDAQSVDRNVFHVHPC